MARKARYSKIMNHISKRLLMESIKNLENSTCKLQQLFRNKESIIHDDSVKEKIRSSMYEMEKHEFILKTLFNEMD